MWSVSNIVYFMMFDLVSGMIIMGTTVPPGFKRMEGPYFDFDATRKFTFFEQHIRYNIYGDRSKDKSSGQYPGKLGDQFK